MRADNIFDSLPQHLESEVLEAIARSPRVRIERILSKGHASPAHGWYDQDESEWVMVVAGQAIVAFEDGSQCELTAGDYIDIPAHVKHKVVWTDPDVVTIWLAVFYQSS